MVQRERVLSALIQLGTDEGELSVANIVESAGIGRNTFYEYFDDIEHAARSIVDRAEEELAHRVDALLESARTPYERIRVFARAWASNLLENAALVRFTLHARWGSLRARARGTGTGTAARDEAQLSALSSHLFARLGSERDSQTALPGLAEPLRLVLVAALFDTVSRAHFGAYPMTAAELERVLSELTLRLLR